MVNNVGLQVYSYDIGDEGADAVVANAELSAASILLPQVLTEANIVTKAEDRAEAVKDVESRLAPKGRLPHNPKRTEHTTDGGAYFQPTENRYPEGLVPTRSFSGDEGEVQIRDLQRAAAEADKSVVPWVILLFHGLAYETPNQCVVNARGESVPGWFCPSKPSTAHFVRGLVEDVIGKFEPPAIFIDRIRFPESGPHGLIDALTCFCSDCQDAARRVGLDLEAVRRDLLALHELLERDPKEFAQLGAGALATPLRLVRSSANRTTVLEWLAFRHGLIENLVVEAKKVTDAHDVELWLDVWPPSYAWLLGQDLGRLARYGKWTKPFTYHTVAGGANIAELIALLSADADTRQRLYRFYLDAFAFPGPPDFPEFAQRGLDPEFIRQENAFAKRLLGGESKLAAGLQLWRLGPDGVREALDQAALAEPDGVFFYCHGWATMEELEAAGDWFRKRRADAK